jgi:iron complex outermembrane receptor protein
LLAWVWVPPAIAQTDADLFGDVPIVLTATRLRQPVKNAPVTVTVIDREMIDASGFTEIPDLMRLVPGFIVDYDSGHLPVTGYHLLHDRYVRHQQVLIDGRSVYTPILGGVPWVDLPITIDDIERIEVIRGPNAASYGSNSFLGVINIITRDAALDKGTHLRVNTGDNGLNEGFFRYGNRVGKMDYRLSLAYRQDWGFEGRHDDKRVRIATFRGDYQVNNSDSLNFQAGYNGGPREEDNALRPSIPDYQRTVNSQFQQVRWIRALPNYGELRLQYYHTALAENKSFPGEDQSFDTERHDIEMQHTFQASTNTRVVWGGSYRKDKTTSAYFISSAAPEYVDIGRLFGNLEYQYSNKMVFNAGLMVEDNDLTGVDLLPRVGVNYHVTPRDTVRFSISRATRQPVLTERYPYLMAPFVINDTLGPEYITAYELGYLTENRDKSIAADIKLYYEDINGLINYFYTSGGSALYFDNYDDVLIRGLEAQLTLRPSKRSRIHVAFAHTYVDSTDRVNTSEYAIAAPKNSLSVLGIWHFDHKLTGSLGFYYNSPHKQLARLAPDPAQYPTYKRVDFRIAKKFKGTKVNQELGLVVQNVFDEVPVSRLKNFPDRRFYISYKLDLP